MGAIETAEKNGFNNIPELQDVVFLTDWYKFWFWNYRNNNIRRVTKQKYCNHFNRINESELNNLKLVDIKRMNIQSHINSYGSSRSKQTVLDYMQTLRSCLKDAVDEGLIRVNPLSNVRIVFKEQNLSNVERKKIIDEKKWLEKEEYQKLKYYLVFYLGKELETDVISAEKTYPQQIRQMVIFLLLKTGARLSEVLALTYKDINFEKGVISIDKTFDYKEYSGFQSTKNLASIREIHVDEQTLNLIESYKKWLDKQALKTRLETLFILDDKKLYNSTLNSSLDQLLRKLDIERISIHKLRHTHASFLIAENVPLQVIAKRLGHADTNMITRVYGHLLKEVETAGNRKILELI